MPESCVFSGCPNPRRRGQAVCSEHYREHRGTDGVPGRTSAHRLTEAEVRAVRKDLGAFLSPTAVARKYNLSLATVRKINRGEYHPRKAKP